MAAVVTVTSPPKDKADVCVPAPALYAITVAKFPPAVQAVPLYSSVALEFAVVKPQNAKPAV